MRGRGLGCEGEDSDARDSDSMENPVRELFECVMISGSLVLSLRICSGLHDTMGWDFRSYKMYLCSGTCGERKPSQCPAMNPVNGLLQTLHTIWLEQKPN
jgi:hypothetical protein